MLARVAAAAKRILGRLLVAAEVTEQHEALVAVLALEGALVVVHMQVVHQVTYFVELSAAAPELANQHLLLAVARLVDAHQFVILSVGLQGLYLYVLVACCALAQEVFVKGRGGRRRLGLLRIQRRHRAAHHRHGGRVPRGRFL